MILLNYTSLDGLLPHSAVRLFLQNLPLNKAQSLSRLVDDKQRTASILGMVLLKSALQQLGIRDFSYHQLNFSPNQKPSSSTNIEFNITHSDNVVACAVSQKSALGIDSETMKHNHKPLLRHVFNEPELHQIDDGTKNFFDLWVKKEAVAKAIGCGVTGMKHIQVNQHTAHYQNQLWYLHELDLQDKDVSYLACKQPDPDIKAQYHSFIDCLNHCTRKNELSHCHG
ncbi:MAG: 4'-phosphopantetheinyl transferase superfamily protein [Gammaproteobacteria bacterium]